MTARDDYPLALGVAMAQWQGKTAWEVGLLLDEIDRLRDLAQATEESRYRWQLRALESESLNFGLRRFARLILSLNRTRAIDEVIEATPVGVLDGCGPECDEDCNALGDGAHAPMCHQWPGGRADDWCPSRYQDTEVEGWFWNCREAAGHIGPHRCDGATW